MAEDKGATATASRVTLGQVWAASEDREIVQLVTFMLAEEEYGFQIEQVQEIIRMRNVKITTIPNAPGFVEGVINLRGRMIPVVDLRMRFGMPSEERGRANRIVVINVEERTVGCVVDEVVEVIRVPRDTVEELPDLAVSIESDFIEGVARVEDRMVIVLDIKRMFSNDEQQSMESLADDAAEQ